MGGPSTGGVTLSGCGPTEAGAAVSHSVENEWIYNYLNQYTDSNYQYTYKSAM